MKRRALLLALWCCSLSACRANIPEQVTADRLLAVEIGMSYDELEALIGPPLCFWEGDIHRQCFSKPTEVPLRLRQHELSLSYAEPSASSPLFEPDIYIHMTDGHVRSVYIKYQDLGICCMEGQPNSPFYWSGSRELLRDLIGR